MRISGAARHSWLPQSMMTDALAKRRGAPSSERAHAERGSTSWWGCDASRCASSMPAPGPSPADAVGWLRALLRSTLLEQRAAASFLAPGHAYFIMHHCLCPRRDECYKLATKKARCWPEAVADPAGSLLPERSLLIIRETHHELPAARLESRLPSAHKSVSAGPLARRTLASNDGWRQGTASGTKDGCGALSLASCVLICNCVWSGGVSSYASQVQRDNELVLLPAGASRCCGASCTLHGVLVSGSRTLDLSIGTSEQPRRRRQLRGGAWQRTELDHCSL
jgi:hypothetical protein